MFPRQPEVLTYLRRLGYTGTVDDCTYNYLRDLTGQTGLALQDLISYYLGTLGYTGSLNDRIAKLEASGVPLFSGVQASFSYKMLALPAYMTALGFTYTRNSAKTVYQNGALVTLSANQFGTTYDSVTGLHAYEAEPAATNLATNSAGAAATWTVSNVVDAVTPIAGFANSLQIGDNSVGRSAYKSITTSIGTNYTVSFFVCMDDGLAPVVGVNATSGDFRIVSEGSGHSATALVTRAFTDSSGLPVYRVSSTRLAASGSGNAGLVKATTQSARTCRIIGIQVETGSRATSYIATGGSTVTRAADVLSCAVANVPGFSTAGYTLVVDGRMDVVPTTNQYLASITDGTVNNRAAIYRSTTAASTIVTSASTPSAGQSVLTTTLARSKSASSFMLDRFLLSHNGSDAVADTAGAMPVNPTTLYVGSLNTASQLNGYIYRVRLIPTALNQAQTTGLTV